MQRSKTFASLLAASAAMGLAYVSTPGHAQTSPARREESDTDRAARLQKRTNEAATNAERDAWNARVDARNRARNRARRV